MQANKNYENDMLIMPLEQLLKLTEAEFLKAFDEYINKQRQANNQNQ